MMISRSTRFAAFVFACLLPGLAFAQPSITGVVKDTSGAVLPGVTVEATSPVLIEKVRSVVTDATGQYRIVDLRPDTCVVSFSLAGFSTVKREGIELTGSFTATVNADLRVGAPGRDDYRHFSLGVLIPLGLNSMAIHGGRTTDQRLMIDGLTIRNIGAQGQATNFIPDMGSTQEVSLLTPTSPNQLGRVCALVNDRLRMRASRRRAFVQGRR